MNCCQYIPASVCASQPGSPPLLYVSTRHLAALGISTTKIFRWIQASNPAGWCFSIDPAGTPECALPSGAKLVNLRGVTTAAACGSCPAAGTGSAHPPGYFFSDGNPGGGGGSGGGGGGGGGTSEVPTPPATGYEGTPCADGNPDPPAVWGVPEPGLANGTYVMRYLAWCYTFVVDGSPDTIPGGVPVVYIRPSTLTCPDAISGIPLSYCGGQGLAPSVEPLFVLLSDRPDPDEQTTWIHNGMCVTYYPSVPAELVPPHAVLLRPRDDFDGCSPCISGVLAVLCPGQQVPERAPVLWVRTSHLPFTFVVDIFRGYRYSIDPAGELFQKPPNAIEYIPKGDYASCNDAACGIKTNYLGIRWLPCPAEQNKKYAQDLWTLEADLPADVITRRIDFITYYLPTEPIQDVPIEAAIVAPYDEFQTCADGGPGGGTDGTGGGGTPADPDDPDPDDTPCPNCGGGSGGGGGGPPPPPPDGGGGGGIIIPPGGDGGGPNPPPPPPDNPTTYCQRFPWACNKYLVNCVTGAVVDYRIPNASPGMVVRLDDGKCYRVTATDHLPEPYPGTFVTYNSCNACRRYCYDYWHYDCVTGAVVNDNTTQCREFAPTGVGVWTWDGTQYNYVQKNGTCSSDTIALCITSASAPSPPGDTSHCKHCYDYWVYDCGTAAITNAGPVCLSSDPAGTGSWTWNGSAYVYIQKNAGCAADEDCTPSATPPDAPGDTSDCPVYYTVRSCDDDSLTGYGFTASEGSGIDKFSYADGCYYRSDTTIVPPAVLLDADDVETETDCPTCLTDHAPACLHMKYYIGGVLACEADLYRSEGSLIYSSAPGGAPDFAGLVLCAENVYIGGLSYYDSTGQWLASAFKFIPGGLTIESGYGFSSGNAYSVPMGTYSEDTGDFPYHSGNYMVISPCEAP